MSKKETKQEQKQVQPKKLNPVFEYFKQFRGTLIINDPALRL